MIGASEALSGIALLVVTHQRTAMAAAIVKDVYFAVFMPAANDGLAADRRREEISGTRNLARVTYEHPRALENALHLQIENGGIYEDPAVDTIILNQRRDRQVACQRAHAKLSLETGARLLNTAASLCAATTTGPHAGKHKSIDRTNRIN